MSFIPTPEKVYRLQVKKDLEKPSFKVSSNWTIHINEIQLEMYLPEIEDEIFNIIQKGRNYQNLTKDYRDSLNSLMKDTD